MLVESPEWFPSLAFCVDQLVSGTAGLCGVLRPYSSYNQEENNVYDHKKKETRTEKMVSSPPLPHTHSRKNRKAQKKNNTVCYVRYHGKL
jgi:hypothetical protein